MMKNTNLIIDKDILYKRLIRLGEMMGDGLHLEPDGKWIEKEYKETMRLLRLIPKKDNSAINNFMVKRCSETKCNCSGKLKQVRKGSFIAKCENCGQKYRLGKSKK